MREGQDVSFSPSEQASIELGRLLLQRGYRFTTITPASHCIVDARAREEGDEQARHVRDVFGWSRPFSASLLDDTLLGLLDRAGGLERTPSGLRSRKRASTIGDRLYLHSAHPTSGEDDLFFGPDTYRFVRFLGASFQGKKHTHLVDVGSGSGAGGLEMLARGFVDRLTLSDINPRAVRAGCVNAAINGLPLDCISFVEGSLLDSVSEPFDAVIANPPFLVDEAERVYRHGGGDRGTGLSIRIASAALERLRPGGTLYLYTASPIVAGEDLLLRDLERLTTDHPGCVLAYEEIDPDVFGEELSRPAYRDVERLAAVGATLRVKPTLRVR